MAKIQLSDSSHMYKCAIDTEVMEVVIEEAFLGVRFVTEDGETLSVSMRDSGFEIHYSGDFDETGFDAGWFDFKGSKVTRRGGQEVD